MTPTPTMSASSGWLSLTVLILLCIAVVATVVAYAVVQGRAAARLREQGERAEREGFVQALGKDMTIPDWRGVLSDHTNSTLVGGYIQGEIDLQQNMMMQVDDKRRMSDMLGPTFSPYAGDDDDNSFAPDISMATLEFMQPGRHTFEVPEDRKVEVLLVAGGGAGGRGASNSFGQGGGGGGGVVHRSTYVVPRSYGNVVPVRVGAGGRANAEPLGGPGGDGENSSFADLVALGGGGGGYFRFVSRDHQTIRRGRQGGSSGGNATSTTSGEYGTKSGVGEALQPGSSTGGRGNRGGMDVLWGGGAGGGGAGTRGRSPPDHGLGGDGGDGWLGSVGVRDTGFYGGGGGGGAEWDLRAGKGGHGGGGAASLHREGEDGDLAVERPAEAGKPNTGGGGGAMKNVDHATGHGGSGYVVVRFRRYQKSGPDGTPIFPVDSPHALLKTSNGGGIDGKARRHHIVVKESTPPAAKQRTLAVQGVAERAKKGGNVTIESGDVEAWEDLDLKQFEKSKHADCPFRYYVVLRAGHPPLKYDFDVPDNGNYAFEVFRYVPHARRAQLGVRVGEDSSFDAWEVPSGFGWTKWKTTDLRRGPISLSLKPQDLIGLAAVRLSRGADNWKHQVDWPGGDMMVLGPEDVSDVNACVVECARRTQCKGLAFKSDTGKCHLKDRLNSSGERPDNDTNVWVKFP